MKRSALSERQQAQTASALRSQADEPSWMRITPGGCVLELALIPNARRNEWAGTHDGALRLRLLAPPVDGAANQALLRWLADEFGVRLSQVELISGPTSRRKRIALTCTPAQRDQWLANLPPSLSSTTPG
ncbi:MAG: hypothetical protein RIQ60_3986 [Pseudomonadota bacterium]|jgi:uncharacterized protein (TIGR00251 family)